MVNGAKVHVELFIFNIFGIYVSLVHSNFNFEEIYGVKYGFEISKEPVLLKESQGAGNTLLLSSKHGQQYQCILPQLEASEKENEGNKILSKHEIPLLLEPLKKKCLYNNKGWWTYEVCFGKGIYQYHEEANQAVGDKISLGIFSNETDWSQENIEKVKPKAGKSAVIKNFHSQYYANGSECDLTGKARETQIKIYCEEGSADLVLRVDEPLSCSYVITVYTNKLCKHSLFRSLHTQEPQLITCSPALSEEHYKIYTEGVESKKKAKAEAEAAKLQIKKARAAAEKLDAEDEIEEDEKEEVSFKKKNKRSRRSQVWPWQDPGVENEDEVWIDGRIDNNEIDVHRLDVTKGQKTNEKGERLDEGLTIMSQSMHRRREVRKKGDVEEKGKRHADDDMKRKEEIQKQNQRKKTVDAEQSEDGDDSEDKHKGPVATEKENDKDSEEKKSEKEDESEDIEEEKAATPDDVNNKIGKKATGKEHDPLEEKWKKKMEEAVLKLRSSLKDKLVQLGLKPEVLDQKFKEKLGSVMGEDGEEGESSAASWGEDEQEAEKVEEKEKETPEMEKLEKMATKDPFVKSFEEMNKILNEDMMKEILDVAAETHTEMERKFSEERALMKSNVEEMRAKIKEIEDAEEKSEVKNEQLQQTMNKIKASIDRFEKTNKEFDEDMQAVRELNSEIFSVIGNKESGDTERNLLKLSFKTNRLLRKILLRRFQLEQEAYYIKTMSSKMANGEDDEDIKTDIDSHKDGINHVINKLKTMIQDLDITRDNTRGVAEETGVTPDSHTTAGVRDGDLNSDQGDSGVKVRVSKIKKVVTDDDDDDDDNDDDDSEMAETDLDAKEMEDLNMDKRIRYTTKKMEEMVKQQLKDSGVVPSGKIKVKIVTSKEVLENMNGKSDVKLLSEREETQFRDMILGLLGGSPEAGRERRRQQDLQSNYNLVWNDDGLQEVSREDDDSDGEVEVESF